MNNLTNLPTSPPLLQIFSRIVQNTKISDMHNLQKEKLILIS